MFFKMCEKLGLKVFQQPDNFPIEPVIAAREVELMLSACKVAYGCGNDDHFSLLHGEGVNPESFELKGLVLSLEQTGVETTQSLVRDLKQMLEAEHRKGDGLVSFELANKLVAKLMPR